MYSFREKSLLLLLIFPVIVSFPPTLIFVLDPPIKYKTDFNIKHFIFSSIFFKNEFIKERKI